MGNHHTAASLVSPSFNQQLSQIGQQFQQTLSQLNQGDWNIDLANHFPMVQSLSSDAYNLTYPTTKEQVEHLAMMGPMMPTPEADVSREKQEEINESLGIKDLGISKFEPRNPWESVFKITDKQKQKYRLRVKASKSEEGPTSLNPWFQSIEGDFDTRSLEEIMQAIDFSSMPEGAEAKIRASLEMLGALKEDLTLLLNIILYFFDIEVDLQISFDGNMRAKITEFSHNALYMIDQDKGRKMSFQEQKEYSEEILSDIIDSYKDNTLGMTLGAPISADKINNY
mmetsp:Transcript_17786/g.30130  ORF Transcript_17786/g.30130 Transcript_17786/m.30130 type:complete len:283 (+) Transcript_17786:36-884(+)|eukprot:CAMPEP_0168614660 /NCGR_PEP_ID=MMETSP0449_2-20121227/4096_1 /TAXON_ID=1082188 /ORGANISM="Strombidium rassoulzadegani, Strain ras09" /LENGTH=282 /DNA_ID=CAMNT_0008655361 /DNA_START=28 /DNA_END=876 /DNA_ORIENTATION=-